MKRFHSPLAAWAAGLSLLAAGSALAAPQRAPQAGDPAIVVDAADGWVVVRPDPAGVVVANGKGMVAVMLAPGPLAENQLDAGAAEVLASVGADPASRSEPAMIRGFKGKAYYSRVTKDGVSGSLKLVLVRPDDQHFAAVIEDRNDGIGAADNKAIDAMIASVRFEGLPR
jgi:hypothetical protein